VHAEMVSCYLRAVWELGFGIWDFSTECGLMSAESNTMIENGRLEKNLLLRFSILNLQAWN
jgi:hypothetical protein